MTTQTAPASRDPVLHVTGLTKTFGQGELAVTAVAGVDLDVHPGEVVLVMGPSGSGKTTLLLMLGRHAAPHRWGHPGRRPGHRPRPRAAPARPAGTVALGRSAAC